MAINDEQRNHLKKMMKKILETISENDILNCLKTAKIRAVCQALGGKPSGKRNELILHEICQILKKYDEYNIKNKKTMPKHGFCF